MDRLNLKGYLKKNIVCYVVAVLAMIVSVSLDMLFPQLTRHIVDDVIVGRRMELLDGLLLGILAVGLGRCVCQYVREFLCDYAGSKIGCEIRISVFRKIQSLSADFFDGINSGELMSRVKDDVDRIWDCFTYIGILIAQVAVHTAIALWCMYSISWKLALLPTFCMIAAAAVALLMERRLDNVFESIAQENSELNNTAQENLSGMRTVKAFARENFEIGKFGAHNRRYYELNIKQSRVFVKYNPILQGITHLLPCVVLLSGGIMAIRGGISIGELTAFVQYSMNIVWPMEMLGWLTNGISAARASARRLNRIYAETPQIRENSAPVVKEAVRGDIEFDRVSYTAPGGREILRNVSFSIKAGHTLGIMGATGSGKTTIINLLKRMYDVSSGSIKLDGTDIREISLEQLRRSIACVMQDIFLFSDTISGNVRLGERAELADAAVEKAMIDSCSAEFASKMQDGYETVIGERGVGLSGGQKQRITIARAVSRSAPVLVLDDSTSALDTETERQIQSTLESLAGMTKIIITHRISAVRHADEIIVLDGGTVAEHGTHEQLLEKKGLYYKTYRSQY